MGMIPEVKCRRCGETFSSLRSRCPSCGTRRVAQSTRTPGTTPGTVKGTAAYDRAETNTKWQMIFGLILVVAVILAVIVMVSTSLDGADQVESKVTPPVVSNNIPQIEAPPTAPPTPTPSLEKIDIKFLEKTLETDFTLHLSQNESIELTAVPYPMTIEGVKFNWSVSDDTLLQLEPSDDTQRCQVTILGTIAGGVKLTCEAYGVEKTLTVYLVD